MDSTYYVVQIVYTYDPLLNLIKEKLIVQCAIVLHNPNFLSL